MADKCIFCGGNLVDKEIDYPVIKDNGRKAVIKIKVRFCEADQEFYINEETERYIKAIKQSE